MRLAKFYIARFVQFGLVAVLLTACASTATKKASNSVDEIATRQVEPQPQVENQRPEPPKMELDAELLEQLMVSNFASYGADWGRATQSAQDAAQTSQDYRLARMAAVLALRNQNYQSAAQSAQLWLDLDPENVNAASTLLIALAGSGQVETALQQLRKSEEADKDIDVLIRETAGVLVRQPNADAAMEIISDIVTRHPDSAQVMLSSAYVADYFKRNELMQQWLNRALELKPGWDLAAQMKVSMLRREGLDEERIAYIKRYLAENPKSVSMRIQSAAEFAREENYSSALDVMQQVVVDDPKNVSALTYTAALAQQLEQKSLAVDLYQRALKVDPANDEVRWLLARYAVDEEKYLKAEKLYQQIETKENYFRAQLQVANMRYHTRGLKHAINYLRGLEPETEAEYVDVAVTRHYLLMQDYQYEEAFGHINETMVYLPDNLELAYARALVAAELKELDVVEQDLRLVIERQPDHANALNALGYTLADQTERYQEAKELIAKALELRPNDAHILDSMGWVLYKMKDYSGAIEYLEKAYADDGEVEIAAHLGEVFWESGQKGKANQIWQQALAKDGNNPVLKKTIAHYSKLEAETPIDVREDNELLDADELLKSDEVLNKDSLEETTADPI